MINKSYLALVVFVKGMKGSPTPLCLVLVLDRRGSLAKLLRSQILVIRYAGCPLRTGFTGTHPTNIGTGDIEVIVE